MKKTLLQQAEDLRAQLPAASEGQFSEIARASGGGITPRWVAYFAAGNVPNPGVKTLDMLHAGILAWKKSK